MRKKKKGKKEIFSLTHTSNYSRKIRAGKVSFSRGIANRRLRTGEWNTKARVTHCDVGTVIAAPWRERKREGVRCTEVDFTTRAVADKLEIYAPGGIRLSRLFMPADRDSPH